MSLTKICGFQLLTIWTLAQINYGTRQSLSENVKHDHMTASIMVGFRLPLKCKPTEFMVDLIDLWLLILILHPGESDEYCTD